MQSPGIESLFTQPFTVQPLRHRKLYQFRSGDANIDHKTVDSFGEEWNAFHGFSDEEVEKLGNEYFDIVTPAMLHTGSRVLEVGCGSGRFLKYLANKAGTVVGVDPSDAVYAADNLVGDAPNVHLVRASANALPFADGSFDFVYSIGVLHHIPNTQMAMQGCVDKLRHGGYFFTYLYYNLDNRGPLFRGLFNASTVLRRGISKLKPGAKRAVCDALAVGAYMPFVMTSRFLKRAGVSANVRKKIPLFGYENKSFYVIRNDALDRFGTPLEQRFTKSEVRQMMERCGLTDIVFSNGIPYWHAVGKKT